MKLPVSMLNISEWKAFKGIFPSVDGLHRIVIVHKCNDNCRFFVVTSKTEKAKIRSRYDMGSLVQIHPDQWPDVIKVNSCVECAKRNLKDISEKQLKDMYEKGNLEVLGIVPECIKKRIIQAIRDSHSYSNAEKELLCSLS